MGYRMEIKITLDETEPLARALDERRAAAFNALGVGQSEKSKYSFDLLLGSAFTVTKEYNPNGKSAVFTIVPDYTEIKVDGKPWQPPFGE